MSKQQVILLWVIALVLGITVTAVKISQNDPELNETDRGAGETLLPDFPQEQVAQITITGVTNTVEIAKKDGQWVVANRDDYPARTSSVLEFIRVVGDLRVTRGVEASPSFAPRFGMDADADNSNDRGITATFKNHDGKELATITLGKIIENDRSSGPLGMSATVGRYIRNHADESGFYATSEMFPAITYQPENWLADDFINPEKIESITLSKADSNEPAWTISRISEEAEYQMENTEANEVLNTKTTQPLKTLFSYARFDDVVPESELENRTQDKGHRNATITTFEGFTYELTLVPELGVDNKYLMTAKLNASLPEKRKAPENETAEEAEQRDNAFTQRLTSLTHKLERAKIYDGRVYQVSANTVDPLLKERSELITRATASEPNPPTTNP